MGVAVENIELVAGELRQRLGTDAVLTDEGLLDAYEADTYWKAIASRASGSPLGRPDLVVLAGSDEDVATVLQLANQFGVPVVPWGGGSGSQGGAILTHGGIALDLKGLDHIVDVDEESLTVTAEAGVNGQRLEAELNALGLMLPHYPASAELATVGGYVAARGSGVLSTRYGKIEDLVVALRIVTPTGEVIDTLPVPRHAVGPELTQLFIGSEGTLGVITRATLGLRPLPAARRFEAVSFPSVPKGIAAIRDAIARGYRPSVVRLYDETATRLTLSPVVGEELDGVCTILCFEGDARRCRRRGRRNARARHGARRQDSRRQPGRDLVEETLRILPPAAPSGAPGHVGHDRSRRHVCADLRRLPGCAQRNRALPSGTASHSGST